MQPLAAYQSNNEGIEMAKVDFITPEILRQLLRYEPETGRLFWKERPLSDFKNSRLCNSWNKKYSGKESFTADNGKGYRCSFVFKIPMKAHRVAWAVYYGEWPKGHIDHINGVKSDNAISNLRVATAAENQWNVPRKTESLSGFKGVNWSKIRSQWRARISVNGKSVWLGYFESAEDAHAAYCEAAKKYHGEFARTE